MARSGRDGTERWTKRGFKLLQFISINTTVLSYRRTNCLPLGGCKASGPPLLRRETLRVGRRATTKLVEILRDHRIYGICLSGICCCFSWVGPCFRRRWILDRVKNNDSVGLFIEIACVRGREGKFIGSLTHRVFGGNVVKMSQFCCSGLCGEEGHSV